MGVVEYTALQPGTTSSTDADAIFAAIAAQTAAADASNFAEEGLDKGSMEPAIQSVRAFDNINVTTPGTQPLTTTFVAVDFGTPMVTGAFSVAADEILFVQFSAELLSNSTQEGVPVGGQVKVRLAFDAGAGLNVFNESTQLIRPPVAGGRDARVRCLMKLDGPRSIVYVRAEIADITGNDVTVQMDSAVLTGRIFKRH